MKKKKHNFKSHLIEIRKPFAAMLKESPKIKLLLIFLLIGLSYYYFKSVIHVFEYNVRYLGHFLGADFHIADMVGLFDVFIVSNERGRHKLGFYKRLIMVITNFSVYNLYVYIGFTLLAICVCGGVSILYCTKIIALEWVLHKAIHFLNHDRKSGFCKSCDIWNRIVNFFKR